MRITRSAVGMLLLTMSALALAGSDQTQVVTPFEMPAGSKQHLDHAVPVATVTRMGQPIALAGAKAVYSVMLRSDSGGFLFPTIGGRLESPESRTTWRPGETITVQLPISPVPEGARLQAFLVLVQTVDTPRRADGEKGLLREAFEKISTVQQ